MLLFKLIIFFFLFPPPPLSPLPPQKYIKIIVNVFDVKDTTLFLRDACLGFRALVKSCTTLPQ